MAQGHRERVGEPQRPDLNSPRDGRHRPENQSAAPGLPIPYETRGRSQVWTPPCAYRPVPGSAPCSSPRWRFRWPAGLSTPWRCTGDWLRLAVTLRPGCCGRDGYTAKARQLIDRHTDAVTGLDHFKENNDSSGHAAGAVLAATAKRLTACPGSRAVVGRLGGDESFYELGLVRPIMLLVRCERVEDEREQRDRQHDRPVGRAVGHRSLDASG
ncbi:diguanylate cyclase domain-containing protein [Streptomyces sp. NPDC018833]|uniref:diguanylate cyclase domain-containing protein n=1 Tax=Streptomyces sp. NPDC018833 TaxID=3365053 RepID=UPI0037B7B3F0